MEKENTSVLLFIDCETLPSSERPFASYNEPVPTYSMVPPHGSLKDPIKIEEYKQNKLSSMLDEYAKNKKKVEDEADAEWKKESLISYKGKIFCISFAKGIDGEVNTLDSRRGEKEMLIAFYDQIKQYRVVQFVGANVAFDLMFLFHRSLHHGVMGLANIVRRDKGYSKERDWDIMEMCGAGIEWKYKISLDNICKLLNVPTSKDDLKASQVLDAYLNGEYDRIRHYCEKDIIATRECYKILK